MLNQSKSSQPILTALQLKGAPVAQEILDSVKSRVALFLRDAKKTVKLVVILVGHDPASQVYVSHKIKKCEELGFASQLIQMDTEVEESKLIEVINRLNQDQSCHGILLQLPLPVRLNTRTIVNKISVDKDVDCLTDLALGRLVSQSQTKGQAKDQTKDQHFQNIAPCTPSGIIFMLKHYNIPIQGKRALVIGRSLIVGIPLFHLLINENATVTMAHSKTENLNDMIKNFDLVFVAAGKPHLLKASDFASGATVVDIGIHRIDGKIVGDVDFSESNNLFAYSPVPGGVGPLTIATLMQNTMTVAEKMELARIK